MNQRLRSHGLCKIGYLALVAFLPSLSGCEEVFTVHPLYHSKDRAFDEGLLGEWFESDTASCPRWKFARADSVTYRVSTKVDSIRTTELQGRLVRIREAWFLDLYPQADTTRIATSPECEKWIQRLAVFDRFYMPVHWILRVHRNGSRLGLSVLEEEWIIKRAEGDPERARVVGYGTDLYLTGTTKELRRLLEENLDDAGLFEEFGQYARSDPRGCANDAR